MLPELGCGSSRSFRWPPGSSQVANLQTSLRPLWERACSRKRWYIQHQCD
ncbi:hypothetical protein BN844_3935 [Pseudomonas sp. SHC52]|nr:hypothetical protein BN844_3935 [Pseudomonas sp. SHC52]